MAVDPFGPSEKALRIIYATAHSLLPDEACGFIRSDQSIVLMTNIAPDPRRYFEMDVNDVLDEYDNAARNGCRISAVWHSHPNGSLHWSERDKRYWVPNLLNILVAKIGKEWQAIYH
jgi:proteasome lid subunit RPN8/RPN11